MGMDGGAHLVSRSRGLRKCSLAGLFQGLAVGVTPKRRGEPKNATALSKAQTHRNRRQHDGRPQQARDSAPLTAATASSCFRCRSSNRRWQRWAASSCAWTRGARRRASGVGRRASGVGRRTSDGSVHISPGAGSRSSNGQASRSSFPCPEPSPQRITAVAARAGSVSPGAAVLERTTAAGGRSARPYAV